MKGRGRLLTSTLSLTLSRRRERGFNNLPLTDNSPDQTGLGYRGLGLSAGKEDTIKRRGVRSIKAGDSGTMQRTYARNLRDGILGANSTSILIFSRNGIMI
jgi:hypothetical protein